VRVFSDPETQARHEQNLEWLRLMREDPGWVLSRLRRLAELEKAQEAGDDSDCCWIGDPCPTHLITDREAEDDA
jgi:hypothetical protein